MPKVSVIIPVYNTAPYLRRCLDSVCGQTLRDIEIIVIDDKSDDGSINIIDKYLHNDNRVIFVNNKTNKGPGYCRNIGINLSKGEYISFIDSDDFIDYNFLETLYQNNNGCDIIKGDILMIDTISSKTYRQEWNDLNYDININKSYFCCAFTTAIYHSVFIKKNNIYFPENRKYFEDPRFSIMAAIKSKEIKIYNNIYYYYRNFHKKLTNTSQVICNISEKLYEITSLLTYINNEHLSKNDYIIYASFLYNHIHEIPDTILNNITVVKKIASNLNYFYKNCKWLSEVIELAYTYHKKRQMRRFTQNIRNKLLNKKYYVQ